jgi:cytoskeletal protein RodZ
VATATLEVLSSGPTASRSQRLGLRESRERSGVSLEQIAERTKISMQFLRAIEQEDFGRLPGGIFRTSYLRQYAAAIGLDEGQLLAQYAELSSPETVARTYTPPAPTLAASLLRWLTAKI